MVVGGKGMQYGGNVGDMHDTDMRKAIDAPIAVKVPCGKSSIDDVVADW